MKGVGYKIEWATAYTQGGGINCSKFVNELAIRADLLFYTRQDCSIRIYISSTFFTGLYIIFKP